MQQPIETTYRGIQFRSRLEATWAAFFDQLSWRWEYEPIDFNDWFPDFRLFGHGEIYAEVKPIIAFDKAAASRMERAAPPHVELLLLGQRPGLDVPDSFGDPDSGAREQQLGWLRQGDLPESWGLAIVGTFDHGGIGFGHEYQSYHDRISGAYDGGKQPHPIDLDALWGKAKLATHYEPAQSQ